MSSNTNSNQSTPILSDAESSQERSPSPITQPKVERKERSDKGKSRKKFKAKTPALVIDTDDEAESANESEAESVASNESSTASVASSSVSSAEIVEQKSGKKGTKYPVAEIDIVRDIVNTNPDKLVLTNRQLEIAYWIESENIKSENRANCYTDADCKVRKTHSVNRPIRQVR